MKKCSKYIFVFLILTCIGVGIFLITRNLEIKNNNQNSTGASDNNILNVAVLDTIEMIKGTQKTFYYNVNNSLATIEVNIENEEIAIIDNQNNVFALNCGTTNCNVIATYKTQTVTKTTQIVVDEKEISFFELNPANFVDYKSGVKANNVYDTYTLKITSNFDLSDSVLSLDDNIFISNTTFSNQNTNLIIEYNLLYEGKFEFLIEGFSFSKTATNYISSLNLNFSNVEIVNDKIILYNLVTKKEIAYQDGKYDYARLTELNSFDVLIENINIVSYENLVFMAKNVGETNVVFRACDGSGYELGLIIKIEEINATNCQINLQEISLLIGENFVVELTNFVPVYSTVKNATLTASENLNINGTTINSISAGSGWVKVFLNGTLIHEIQVTVNDLPRPITNYSISIVPPSQVSVNMENMTIYLPLGPVQIRVYIYDEQNNFVQISVEILNGNSSVVVEGNTVSINSANNSVLRITNNENNQYYDFNLVIIE